MLDDSEKAKAEAAADQVKANEDGKMAAESKEVSPEKKKEAEKQTTVSESSLGSIVYSLAKKVVAVGAIYLVGYMGWSVAWLIGA